MKNASKLRERLPSSIFLELFPAYAKQEQKIKL